MREFLSSAAFGAVNTLGQLERNETLEKPLRFRRCTYFLTIIVTNGGKGGLDALQEHPFALRSSKDVGDTVLVLFVFHAVLGIGSRW